MTEEYWQQPELWPKDLSEQNMFLLDLFAQVGRKRDKNWATSPGFYKARGEPIALSLDEATPCDLQFADQLLRFVDFNYSPPYRSDWVPSSDGEVEARVPVLTESDYALAAFALNHGIDQSSPQSIAFINAAVEIATEIAKGNLEATAQIAGETSFVVVPAHQWNVGLDAILARFAFGEATLAKPRSANPRGPDRLYLNAKSAKLFLARIGAGGPREALVAHMMECRRGPLVEDVNTLEAITRALPEEYRAYSPRAIKLAFQEAGKRTSPRGTTGGRPRKA